MYLFDLDGTLIDSNDVWRQVDAQFLSRHGLVETEEYFRRIAHAIFPTAAQFTREYYRLSLTPEEIMAEWFDLAREAYEFHTPLKEGAVDYLELCRSRGPVCLVTASVPQLCRLVLRRHGLTDRFHRILYAQEMGLEKRDPRFFLRVCEALETPPEDCILFDDAPDNCAAAKNCGMTVVGVYDPAFARQESEMAALCDRYIHSFAQLLEEEQNR